MTFEPSGAWLHLSPAGWLSNRLRSGTEFARPASSWPLVIFKASLAEPNGRQTEAKCLAPGYSLRISAVTPKSPGKAIYY